MADSRYYLSMIDLKTAVMTVFSVDRARVNLCFYPHEKQNTLLQTLDTLGPWAMIRFPSDARTTNIAATSFFSIGVDVYWGFDEFTPTEHQEFINLVAEFEAYVVAHITPDITHTAPDYESHDHPARAKISFMANFVGSGSCT